MHDSAEEFFEQAVVALLEAGKKAQEAGQFLEVATLLSVRTLHAVQHNAIDLDEAKKAGALVREGVRGALDALRASVDRLEAGPQPGDATVTVLTADDLGKMRKGDLH